MVGNPVKIVSIKLRVQVNPSEEDGNQLFWRPR